MQMQLDPSLQEDLQSVYAKILKCEYFTNCIDDYTIMSLFVQKTSTGAYVVSIPRDNRNSLELLLLFF